ncbi:bifunctional apoptosis regulator-like [Mizuhopecten yessoensis]|uniref:Bifunctional apoptosis regulator n=1 Tax=Mizuhopecten yessoensis TaxID=6573 RepID=A0A210PTC0_MIZYE|nr:bifunctional apoptosis regulator-like [Mizuhopecten yessoensis]XP_021375687.1 bifunctional apoptosis regulator-like [Mizuhopecten yessoensis]OWF39731.1 Bifunctional apoptosis regulator [Mizuhopecten yessoensis]
MTEMTTSPNPLERQTSSYDMDIKCHICYELLVMPSSLACGHTFCRLCLAEWYNTSKRLECPDCRSPWQEVPKVNIFIREVLEKYYAEKLKTREETLNTERNNKILEEFEIFGQNLKENRLVGRNVVEQQGRVLQGPQRNLVQLKDFFSGFVVAAAILMLIYVGWYWGYNSDSGMLVYKPAQRWDPEEVGTWLGELGAWSAEYANKATEQLIDGRQLLVMEESDFAQKLNITDSLQMKVLLRSLHELADKGTKLPGTLWEYKSLHPGLAMLLLYGMKDYPRTTILFMYLFEYDNIFIPFVHYTCMDSEESLNMFDNVTSRQLTEFVSWGLFLPYYLIGIFAYDWTSTHYWISRMVILSCMAQTYLECTFIANFVRGGYRNASTVGKSYGKSLLSGVFFIIIWPVVPNFICNMFFYVALYLSPYVSLEKMYHHIKNTNLRN